MASMGLHRQGWWHREEEADIGIVDRGDCAMALAVACETVGLDPRGAVPLHVRENVVHRLPGGVVARASWRGHRTAVKEVAAARWMRAEGIDAVRPLDVNQPVTAAGVSVTFWEELPPHVRSTPAQLAGVLRQLHTTPRPGDPALDALDPFVLLDERIAAVDGHFRDDDVRWLRGRLTELRHRYPATAATDTTCVIHGDASLSNIVATDDGRVVLMDLEAVALGPPAWDLLPVTMAHLHLGLVDHSAYRGFCNAYGRDVRTWQGWELLLGIQELRSICLFARVAVETGDARVRAEAELRLACVQGKHGPRPWPWTVQR